MTVYQLFTALRQFPQQAIVKINGLDMDGFEYHANGSPVIQEAGVVHLKSVKVSGVIIGTAPPSLDIKRKRGRPRKVLT